MAVAGTTKLRAINIMLASIDEEPVETIDGVQPLEVEQAKDILDEISKEIQQQGWDFNTEYEYNLPPNVDGEVELPASTLEFDAPHFEGNGLNEYVQRGLRVYDKKKKTYNIGKAIKATMVFFLDWEEMPEPFRRWIMIRAARIFSNRTTGDQVANQYTQQQEIEAKVTAINLDARTRNATIFDGGISHTILDRRIRGGRGLSHYGY